MAKTRKVSELSVYKRLSPNCTKPRNNTIKRITPHCVAGNLTIEATLGLSRFVNADPVNGASCNYAIGTDGRIGLGVEETNRAWTTSSGTNDHQAITFEIANNGDSPTWSMSDAAIEAWVKMSVDICQFYGYKRVMYKAKPSSVALGNTPTEDWIKTWNAPADAMLITLHCWYANKACPGSYFMGKLPSLVDEINKRLGATVPVTPPVTPPVAPTEPEKPITPPSTGGVTKGSKVKIQDNATYYTGKSIPGWVKSDTWIVTEVKGDRAVLGENTSGKNNINSPISTDFLTVVGGASTPAPSNSSVSYLIKITVSAINIRKSPNVNTAVVKTLVNDKNTYTIVEEADGPGDSKGTTIKWGKLKSGIGWIALMYTKKA